ncbi:hypothetical protein UFOVP456_18 [uncultured Caudovirales phage]|jgi:hypothetical protein|uniref:Uncharacterized protein n=1 Tax=uncultured Caudovirales phage TaxID=2100421 RepID=A0A6J5MKH5_9CAUD|nr:hypothetical protein UFOVP456_18 [uncultured Caudovirales phage]
MNAVADLYEATEFEDMLHSAESNAANAWEQDFVSGVREKWLLYGRRMFLSDKQDEILKRIASDES